MSRIKVIGSYIESGAYELRYADTYVPAPSVWDGSAREGGWKSGDIYQTIEPGEVFSIGNSIGGFYARPITFAGEKRLSLIRVSGSKKDFSPERLRKLTSGEKGLVLKPGFIGLWATSSGSAMNGIFHRYTPPADEVEQMLEKLGYGKSALHRVDTIDEKVSIGGAEWSDHSRIDNGMVTSFDGEHETSVESWHIDDRGTWKYITCRAPSDVCQITGGTFLVSVSAQQGMNGYWSHHLEGLWVTPTVNLEALQEALFPEYAREKEVEREAEQKARNEADTAEAKRLWAIIASDVEKRLGGVHKAGHTHYEMFGTEGVFHYKEDIYYVNACSRDSWEEGLPRKRSYASSRISLLDAYRSGLLTAWAEAVEADKLAE